MQLSIIIPIHNEILYISRSFESIILAGSEIESEFFFVDGQSNDGTYEWIKKEIKKIDNCRLILNDKKFVSHGFNIVFNDTKGEFISRVDGHTIYPKSYFSDAIDIFRKNNADVVGGPANHIGIGWKGKVIANCMMHPFGVGNSKSCTCCYITLKVSAFLGATVKIVAVSFSGIFCSSITKVICYVYNYFWKNNVYFL